MSTPFPLLLRTCQEIPGSILKDARLARQRARHSQRWPRSEATEDYAVAKQQQQVPWAHCAHHCQDSNYCGLDTITVGTHEANPTEVKCTDCESFKLK